MNNNLNFGDLVVSGEKQERSKSGDILELRPNTNGLYRRKNRAEGRVVVGGRAGVVLGGWSGDGKEGSAHKGTPASQGTVSVPCFLAAA